MHETLNVQIPVLWLDIAQYINHIMCRKALYFVYYATILNVKEFLFVLITDVNECMDNTDNCSQNCINTIGSYYCYCNDGYTLDSDDQHTCNGM